MTKRFLVSADHVSPRFACNGYVAVCSQYAGTELWYAKVPDYGCSKNYRTPEIAITEMLREHACTNIRITPLVPVTVFQDGRDFYIGDDEATRQIVTAPMAVPDMDLAAAENARDWFCKVWSPRNAIDPQFCGETF